MGRRDEEVITITVVAQRCGLSTSTVRRYLRRGLVEEPLVEEDLVTLRRIRRLADMGVNLAGIEVILAMRRRIVELQTEIAWLRERLDS